MGPTTKSIVGPPNHSLSGLQTPEVVESGGANSCPQTRRLRTKPSTGRASVVGVEVVVVFWCWILVTSVIGKKYLQIMDKSIERDTWTSMESSITAVKSAMNGS